MASRVLSAVAGVAALVMPSTPIWAQEEEIEPRQELVDLRVCTRHKHRALSEDERAVCAFFKSLDRQGRYKAIVMQRLRRLNKPPVAAIEVLQVLPRRVDVSAEESTDEDGFPELYDFSLEDADTGDVLAGPITTREPVAGLETNQDLPQSFRVRVVVEDDLRAIDTAEMVVPLAASTQCSDAFFSCATEQEGTTCTPSESNTSFTTDDVLDAAQRCDPEINKSTPMTITARGASGGKGANFGVGNGGFGGEGGSARMVTTLAHLDEVYGLPGSTSYCYGLGQQGGQSGSGLGGAGGASTLLRTCENVSQQETTGVLLIGGGGGGGAPGDILFNGRNGNAGGIAASGPGGPANGPGFGGGRGGGAGQGGTGNLKNGKDGIGGKGGPSPWGTAGWRRGDPRVDGDTGQGGAEAFNSAGGGGGWGGGAVARNNGGGGGGSFATAGVAQASNAGISKGPGSLTFHFTP